MRRLDLFGATAARPWLTISDPHPTSEIATALCVRSRESFGQSRSFGDDHGAIMRRNVRYSQATYEGAMVFPVPTLSEWKRPLQAIQRI